MGDLATIKTKIKTELQSNIRDPNDQRRERNGDWITTQEKFTELREYPRVRIKDLNPNREPRGINDTRRNTTANIQIEIYWNVNDKIDPLNPGTELEPGQACLKFAEHIASYIDDNQNVWEETNDVKGIRTTAVENRDEPRAKTIRRDVIAQALYSTSTYQQVTT